MMQADLLSIIFGLLGGILVTSAFLVQVMKRRLAGQESTSRVEAAIAQTTIETRLHEIEALNVRLRELSEQMSEKEGLLQSARISEATLQTSLHEQEKQNKEKLELLEKAREQMNAEFKLIASEIFDAKHKVFKAESKEQLGNLLSPLSDRIKDFEKRVEKSYNDESKERFSLVKEVRNLQELNSRISKDAINLTNALKGESKTQGTWGEIILERVLERSGLEKGREYEVQVSLKNEDGKRLQPDVIVHLPEEKDVVIDSKVSLTAYERYCSADDDLDRADSLKLHLQSIRQHIKQLGEKDYHKLEGIRTLDFVLLFVPIEAAFSLAVQQDNELFTDAFQKNIVIAAPSTLLATLRTIQNIWRFEQQNKNAQEIASKAGALYDKFVNFVSDVENVGARIDSAQTAYRDAHNKLSSGKGNLIRRAEGMKELGAKVSKSLPQHLIEMPEIEKLEPPQEDLHVEK
jgi:DNA recombination protein RmuC